jgi:Uma2 family endonuclease
MGAKSQITIEDLYHLPENGKVEIVNGELLLISPTGGAPGYAADEVFVSLRNYSRLHKTGRAVADNKGFHVHLPNRESFSPGVAFYIGPDPKTKFFEGAPVFAVEVRSEQDYGPTAEENIANKRADYFAAGTLVVWDVDLLSAEVVKVYRATDPSNPKPYRRSDIAEAEPAVPGWTMPVDDLFQ